MCGLYEKVIKSFMRAKKRGGVVKLHFDTPPLAQFKIIKACPVIRYIEINKVRSLVLLSPPLVLLQFGVDRQLFVGNGVELMLRFRFGRYGSGKVVFATGLVGFDVTLAL